MLSATRLHNKTEWQLPRDTKMVGNLCEITLFSGLLIVCRINIDNINGPPCCTFTDGKLNISMSMSSLASNVWKEFFWRHVSMLESSYIQSTRSTRKTVFACKQTNKPTSQPTSYQACSDNSFTPSLLHLITVHQILASTFETIL